MANLLYFSVGHERHGRAYVFGRDVAWSAVHRSKMPAVVVYTASGCNYFYADELRQAQKFIESLLCHTSGEDKEARCPTRG